jgi:prepilin-type N-terminal cleavage/methylation domain-containing protein
MMRRDAGFTLLELLVTMAIVAILTAIALPAYSQYRMRSFDAAARSDLRNAMTAIETAITSTGSPPPAATNLTQYGHRTSAGVSFTKYTVETKDGMPSVHMHTKHANSTNAWHAHYPADGSNIEIRP